MQCINISRKLFLLNRQLGLHFNRFNSFYSNLGSCDIIIEPGHVSKERKVPDHIQKPHYYSIRNSPSQTQGSIELKTDDQIQRMRESCKLAAQILQECSEVVQVGNTTDDIDKFVHNRTIQLNAYPSPLRYCGYPKSVCTSVNNVACHGIPDDRMLVDGDIINVDVTVFYNGYHGDCSKTLLVGNVDDRGRYLVQVTEESVYEAIKCCGPNQPFSYIGKSISRYARKKKLNVVPAFIGHGIGSFFHGPPEVLHYDNDLKGFMLPRMVFTIEPILSLGTFEVEILEDEWTAVTTDNSRTAQHEHTVLITENGCEILTLLD